MAKYICPSCGAEFNGKKCKSCNYEALAGGQPHRPSPEPKPPVHAPGPFANPPAPHRVGPGSGSSRKKRRTGHRNVLIAVCMVVTCLLFLESALTLLSRRLVSSFSGSTAAFPACSEPEIPPLNDDYELLYEDNDFTVWTNLQKMWQEGIVYITVENRTKQAVELFSDDVVLNDRLCSSDSSLYVEAEGGGIGQGKFYLEPLSQEGAPVYPAKVSFRLYVCDPKSYETRLQTDTLTLTAPVGELVPIAQPEGTLVAQDEGMQLVYISWEDPEDLPSSTLHFGMINDTDRELSFYCDSARANGEDVGITLFCTLPPHTVAYDDAYCWAIQEDLDIASLDQLDSLELTMGVFDEEAPEGVTLFPSFSVPIP